MALGKPIVTTEMNECMKYKSVAIAHNTEEFIDLIDKSVKIAKDGDEDYYKILKKEALDNTWKAKANEIIALLKMYEK